MLRMIICDDEPNTRFGLRDSFPWKSFGIECVGAAANGEEALDLVFEKNPDFVLTDVRMPFMDGIELSRVLRAQNYRGKIVFISAYDDVEYLRAALRVEAVDYLVKPVAVRELEELTVRVADSIAREREKDELFKRGLASLRDRLLLNLLAREFPDAARLAERSESLGLDLPVDASYTVLVADPDEGEAAFAALSERDGALARMRLADRLREEAELRGACRVLEDTAGRLVCVLAGPTAVAVATATATVVAHTAAEAGPAAGTAAATTLAAAAAVAAETAEAFRRAAPLVIGATVSVGVGQPAAGLGSVSRSYRQALCALEKRAELGKDSVLDFAELSAPSDSDGARSAAPTAGDSCPEPSAGPDRGGRSRMVAARVDEIIEARYAENLTIKDIASDVYLTPTYLCLLFKQETGETINDRLTRIRIAKAQEALRDFRKKSYEVCYEVGYGDPTHFARTFKRLTGMSPSAYRNSLSGAGGGA